jgi:hypothetical protein
MATKLNGKSSVAEPEPQGAASFWVELEPQHDAALAPTAPNVMFNMDSVQRKGTN